MSNSCNLGDPNNPDHFYASLKEKLEATHNFPEDYQFKFIVLNEEKKITDWATLKYNIRDSLKAYLYGKIKRNPMILPIIMEV